MTADLRQVSAPHPGRIGDRVSAPHRGDSLSLRALKEHP